LIRLGWDKQLSATFAPHAGRDLVPGRVAIEHRSAYVIHTESGELWAETSGSFRHNAASQEDMPCVGDWVAVDARPGEGRATIHAVLPRKTRFSRKVAGFTTEEQVLAANIDMAFLVAALDADLNVRRLERYLTMAWASGASPVIVLSKADLCEDLPAALAEVGAVALGVPVHVTSVVTGDGIGELRGYLTGSRTIAVLGSSGVGKSSLINELGGGETTQTVREIRDDGKGRHTTTHRELLVLPGGGIIVDTPGLRELQLWDEAEGLDDAFADIANLARECRFRDCRHEREPDCAVIAAMQAGTLPKARYESFKKLERELYHLHLKQNQRAAADEKRKRRAFSKSHRNSKPVDI
jgi:ribosome biogenesis GTPase / thiamine phosphate phosphatase